MLEIKKTPQGQVWLCGVLFLGGRVFYGYSRISYVFLGFLYSLYIFQEGGGWLADGEGAMVHVPYSVAVAQCDVEVVGG